MGAALTLGAMFFLNPSFAALTVAIVVVLYAYISLRQDLDVNNAKGWADISQALAFNAASAALRSLARQRPSAKYWRPALLLLLPQRAAAECVGLAVHLASGGLLLAGRALTPHDGGSSGGGGSNGRSGGGNSDDNGGGGGGGGGRRQIRPTTTSGASLGQVEKRGSEHEVGRQLVGGGTL